MTDSEYILVMNPDVILEPDFLERIIDVAEKNKKAGSFGGKLLKAKITNIESNKEMALNPLKFGALMHPNWCIVKTDIIDSTGLKIFKSRRVIDRGEGEKDTGQYDRQEEVFGISGACVLYRRKAIEDVLPRINADETRINADIRLRPDICRDYGGQVSVNLRPAKRNQRKSAFAEGEYFDQDFFCYKEDIDLAWRLQLRGWKAIYVPEAKAYHLRTVSIANRFSKSAWINFLSYRNHLWILLKNDYFRNFLLHLWYIFWYQLAKEIYLLFTQPLVLWKGSFAFWQGFFKMYKKRRYIMKNVKIGAREIRQWFN
jgi:GT2 family glycosyltransferase